MPTFAFHTRTKSRRVAGTIMLLLTGLLGSFSTQAALVTYTLSGINMNGSLDGVSFSNASWSITGEGDTANVQAISQGGISGLSNFLAPTITIADASNDWSVQLLDTVDSAWGVASFDLNSIGQDVSYSNFALVNTSTFEGPGFISAVVPANASDLVTPVLLNGFSLQSTGTFATSGGDLVIDEDQGASPSTFQVVASVPLPGTLALLALGMIWIGRERRRRVS